jgi:hypothetical protein
MIFRNSRDRQAHQGGAMKFRKNRVRPSISSTAALDFSQPITNQQAAPDAFSVLG